MDFLNFSHLTRNKAVARKISVPIVSDVAVDGLLQGPKGGNVGVRHRVKNVDLMTE